uniref:Uncharacterized protein n=1 Tax=Octopus bimaculoides TaxID=37653 RepID=A0A0L8FTL2_OCTBM
MVDELERNLTLQQTFLTKAKSQTEAAIKASFIVAEEITKSAQSFIEGEFVKRCMMKMYNVLYSDKKQLFANVSISRNTVADWVCEMATDLKTQLIEKGKDFLTYSLAVDETTDMTDMAHLAILILGVDSNFFVIEEILYIKSMHETTTGKDHFEKICQSVTNMKLPWDKLVELTTDRAPAMCGEKSGLVCRILLKMQEENCAGELTTYLCIKHQEILCTKALKMEHVMTKGLNHHQFQSFLWEIHLEFDYMPYHTEVQWLGWGKIHNIVFELVEEICQFMDIRRDEKWECELVFLVDITVHLNVLNIQLQGQDHMICDMYDAVKAFQVKLCIWETHMHQLNLSHLLCCQVILSQVSVMVFPRQLFADKLSALCTEFARHFSDFQAQKNHFELLCNPFAINEETAPVQIQMELIELQCNGALKTKYESVGPAQFTRFIPECPNSIYIQLECYLCLEAHIHASSCSL